VIIVKKRVVMLFALCLLLLLIGQVKNLSAEGQTPGGTVVKSGAPPAPAPIPLSNRQQQEIKKIFDDPILKNAQLSVKVQRVRDGKPLLARQSNQLCIPASTNKLVTGSAALNLLGPQYRFVTKVLADSRPDAEGNVHGNLYIVGSGDPSLDLEQVYALAHGVRIAGVKRVLGDLVGDDSFHDQERFYADWGRQTHRAYHASLGALSVNYNTIAFWVRPGAAEGAPATVTIEPLLPGAKVSGTIQTVAGAGNKCYLNLTNGSAHVSGSVGLLAQPNPTFHAVSDPLPLALAAFREALAKEGVKIVGQSRGGKAPANKFLMYKHESEQLSLILRHLFRFSNNFTAEQILRTIGAVQTRQAGSRQNGAQAVTDWLKRNNLYQEGAVVYDGSGLSRQNLQSADSMVSILHCMARNPRVFPEFLEAQPIAGVDGTLRFRFRKSALKGRVRAKTGLLNGVISLAGYCYDARGELYSFAALVNNYQPNQGVRGPQLLTERLLEVLME